MAGIKTAISLEQGLLEQIKKNAEEMNISRSKFFSIAVKEFIQRRQNQKMLAKLNSVYGDEMDTDKFENQDAMRNKQFQLLKDEPWK
ncbi:MAG: CopG family transcriptional regulator [Calditrichaeota bacterium]|nr:MAG: CopG family transcriptional regulator [Calditrichota bacterium]MBL1206438.1 CopG family transcriptional regulator [Calditrichota bacterium]NOG46265.1 CopG family transcriptional regulator [Calditrichota bacterium]